MIPIRVKSLLPRSIVLALVLLLPCCGVIAADGGNRFIHLEGSDPYYVNRKTARLATPQWIGEPDVEAVVILAIDDMRGHEKWETFLRPILDRLKAIDGRAATSIMTCQIPPQDPHLQSWLKEGVSLECHTYDHPCPLLKQGDLNAARKTYERCVDLLQSVPGNKPVAFRTPCCDSQNTVSPRFFTEIFNQRTSGGNFLSIDSSVFQVLTANDPELPRELVIDSDGSERFRKYLPFPAFANTIEDYPYPYVIGKVCWEFPCIVPSDWEAQHVFKPANPRAVDDLKAALDAVVVKQGCFNFVFHPYGWIANTQLVEWIDYVHRKYGPRVKFLTFREAQERINQHLLAGEPLRAANGADNGVRILDVNADGYMDVVIGNDRVRRTRIWSPENKTWNDLAFPAQLVRGPVGQQQTTGARFGVIDSQSVLLVQDDAQSGAWRFNGTTWVESPTLLPDKSLKTADSGLDQGLRFYDLDLDGCSELLVGNDRCQSEFKWRPSYDQDSNAGHWEKLTWKLPEGARFVDQNGCDAGLRLIDLDDDLDLDLIFSNEHESGLHLLKSVDEGYQQILASSRSQETSPIPEFVRGGTNNGAWFHSRAIWVQNENTDKKPDLVDHVSFSDLLEGVAPAPKSPAASLVAAKPRAGFQLELIAAEPLVADCIAFDWGADGSLWVVEMADYPDGVNGGRVRHLTDSDGDGDYDKSSVFLDHLRYPTSVLAWRKGILVTASPDLLYAEDTDGDGVADRREPLFTGFAEGNPQHQVNGLAWGLDNWIYGANGDSGGKVRSLKTGQTTSIGGRDFRFRPDDGRFESIEGYTQFNRNRDDWGNWFGNSNADPMWQYVLEDHYLSRNPHLPAPSGKHDVSDHPGVSAVFPRSRLLERFNDPHTANHFTSACSSIVYRDDLFGPDFTGNAFICEPVHNLVHREIMTKNRLLFASHRAIDEQRSEFLASTDNWFRPTTVRTGPDGALWIADMYRAVIEHTEWIPDAVEAQIDVRAGDNRGRIYRVFPVGVRPRALPDFASKDSAKLVALLESPNGWVRDKVQQLLFERQDPASVPALEIMSNRGQHPTARLHALCSLDGFGAVQPRILIAACSDPHGGVRRHAVRLAEPLLDTSAELQSAVLALLDDPDPQVQLQLAYSLGESKSDAAGRALGQLARRHANDSWILAAAMSSAVPHLDTMVATVVAEAQSSDGIAGLIAQLLEMSAATQNNETIVKLIPVISLRGDAGFAPWQMTALAKLLDLLDRRKTSLAEFRNSASDELKQQIDRLAAIFAEAATLAQNPDRPIEDRQVAIHLLARGLTNQQVEVAVLTALLGPENPDEIRQAAIQALGQLKNDSIPSILLGDWKSLSPSTRGQAIEILMNREPYAAELLTSLEQGTIQRSEIDASRRQRLLTYRSPSLRKRAEKIFASGLDQNRAKIIADYQARLPGPANTARGAELFTKHCSVCHRLNSAGFAIGPDLSALTDKSPQAMLAAILDPNRAIESKYISYAAVTKTGLTYTGLLASEAGNSLTLLGQENKSQTILRADLELLESSGKSLMPEGMEKDLAPVDVADVIAYLRQNEAKPKDLPGNRPELVRPEQLRGFIFCLAGNAEIYGDSLRVEEANSNLGWWTAENDHAVWSIEVPREMVYAVMLDTACDPGSTGNQWLLECDAQRLAGTTESTGDWNTYKRVKVGELHLRPGTHRLGLRSNGPIRGALFDLRSVTLIPYGRLVK